MNMDQGNTPQTPNGSESPFDSFRRMRDEQLRAAVSSSSAQQTPTNIENSDRRIEDNQSVSNNSSQNSGKERLTFLGLIEKVQFGFLLLALLVIPSIILPVPWIWAEFGKGITLILFTIVIVTLEVVKIFLTGKFSVVKGFLDLAALLILVSFLLSSILSQDGGMSMWGFDFKMGTGVVVLISMVLFTYVLRSFMKSRESMGTVLFALIIGITLSALLSIVSFFGVNLLGFLNPVEHLFSPGLPVLTASVIAIVVWGGAILLGAFYILFSGEKSMVQVGVVTALSVVNMLALNLFSLNQGLYVAVLVIVTMLVFLVMMFMNRDVLNGTRVTLVTIMTVLLALSFIVFKIPAVGQNLAERNEAITQVSLPVDVTWTIATQTLSQSVKQGVVGFGVDTFSVYFNMFKPASVNDIDITVTNYHYGANEILTLMGNRGIAGAIIWLIVGVMIVIQTIKDLGNSDKKSREYMAFTQFADILLLFVYASSFFIPYGFELYFLLFILFTLRILVGAVLDPKNAESFVVKLDILVERAVQSKSNFLLVGLATVAGIVGLLFLSLSFRTLSSHVNAMLIENRIIQVQLDIANADKDRDSDEPTNYPFEDRQSELVDMINRYNVDVISVNPENSAFQRRRTMLFNEYIILLSNQLREDVSLYRDENGEDSKPEEDPDIKALQEDLNRVIEGAIDSGEASTNNNNIVFANWDSRGAVYSNLLGLGLTSYASTGINVVSNSILLNPTCYACYYRLSEMHVINQDVENAAGAVSRALQINPNHIPSLTLGAEIAISQKDYESAKLLLERALDVLEAVEAEESDLYTSIQTRLESVNDAIDGKGDLIENLDPSDLPEEDDLDVSDADLPDDPLDVDNLANPSRNGTTTGTEDEEDDDEDQ